MRIPQPTVCARFLVPKKCRLDSQPARRSCFPFLLTSFVREWNASLRVAIGHRFPDVRPCHPAAQNFAPGFHDRARTRFPQAPIDQDCYLSVPGDGSQANGYQSGAPAHILAGLCHQHAYPRARASHRRSQHTGSVRSRFQGWQTHLGTVHPGTCRFRVVSHPGSRVPPCQSCFNSTLLALLARGVGCEPSHGRSISLRPPRGRGNIVQGCLVAEQGEPRSIPSAQ